jgi:ABC-type antimicrobial peptide transport system permease subunit
MSSIGFPISDLLRRKQQTSLTLATLTLSVASTLFLLLFSSRLGLGVASAKGILTVGLITIFGQFIIFIGILIFVVGAVLTSFIVFLMMAQRTRDFGLIKAAGCPNSLVAGYFMTELLGVTFLGSVLGIVFGFLMDFAAANLFFSDYGSPNLWWIPVVFLTFFVLAIFFGLSPILKASRMSPTKALSVANYYGLAVGAKHRALPRSGLTWRLASRSLFRRQSAIMRIVFLLSIVFILLTVSVAGGIIADNTTTSWVQKTVDSNTIAIAHANMENQYKLLLSTFSGVKDTSNFDYLNKNLGISNEVVVKLNGLPGVNLVDSRLITKEQVREIGNFTIDPDTLGTFPVGDSRQGQSIVIGVDPQKIASEWTTKGRFLNGNTDLEAVIGDSISQTMYAPHPSRTVVLANPLLEGIEFQNTTFSIVGVCVDPINNGFVTYVPLERLENVIGISSPNLLLIKLNNSADRNEVIGEIKNTVQALDPNLVVFDLSAVVHQNTVFLASTWQTIMFLPLFTLASAAISLVGYMMLTVDEQHQEFAILRAVGAKSRLVVNILAIQSAIVLLFSFAVGLSLGIFITLLILMANPLVTIATLVEIVVWLLSALLGMFILSLYPAFKIAKISILKIMT